MKKLILVAILGTFAFLARRGVVYAARPDPLDVNVTCPQSLDRKASNTVHFTVENRTEDPQTIERFAIGYLGNNAKQGPIISGPFNAPVGPITLAPFETQDIDISFPPVPNIYPLDTVIAPFGAIYTRGKILGKGACPAPVQAQ